MTSKLPLVLIVIFILLSLISIFNINSLTGYQIAEQGNLCTSTEGNVGIGTTTPQEKLTVVGKVETTEGVKFSDGTIQTSAVQQSLPSGWTEDAVGNKIILTNTGRNIGIGTSIPEVALHITQNIEIPNFIGDNNQGLRITGTNVNDKWVLLGFDGGQGKNLAQIGSKQTSAGSYLSFGTSNNYGTGITNEAMTIDPSGKVKIGSLDTSVQLVARTSSTNYAAFILGNTYGLYSSGSAFGIVGQSQQYAALFQNLQNTGNYCYFGAPNYALWCSGNAYATTFSQTSDAKLKENIYYIDSSLDIIKKLKPATFDYINGNKNQAGFIAQDVKEVIPSAISETNEGYLSLNSENILAHTVKAVQELTEENKKLKQEIEALKNY
ncbi:tail fiber domain-containing protein [Candidatus Woesearchaeota archaeon]|nr:tail fiber domain-containing protein [Candidatus Woesearchaeota archaeon]